MDSVTKQFPSFFKVLIGDYAKKLRIPPAFQANFSGKIPKNVMIKAKRGESKWSVKIEQFGESFYFNGDGWEMLVLDNDLKNGDFLIFRLISRTVFGITTYGTSGCEKVALDAKSKSAKTPCYDLVISGENEKRVTVAPFRRSSRNREDSPAGASIRRPVGRPKIVAREGGAKMKNNLSFVVVLRKHHKSYLTIPRGFVLGAALEGQKFVVLKNKRGKMWPVDIRKRTNVGACGRIDTGSGWRNFWDDNNLTISDSCLFKFVPGSANVIKVEISSAK